MTPVLFCMRGARCVCTILCSALTGRLTGGPALCKRACCVFKLAMVAQAGCPTTVMGLHPPGTSRGASRGTPHVHAIWLQCRCHGVQHPS